MMLSQQLKRETLASHRRTEELLFADDIRRHTLSLEQYNSLITTTHRVWSAVARWLDQQPSAPPGMLQDRRFVREMITALQADLEVLNRTVPTTELNIELPAGQLPAHYGVVYVLRGSTLGGKLIARALEKCTGLQSISAFNFYQACAALPVKDWVEFINRLDKEVRSPAAQEQAVRAANYLFDVFAVSTP